MSKVFFSVGISLDGFIAGPNGGPDNPLGDNGTSIHKWVYRQKKIYKSPAIGRGWRNRPR